MNNEQDLFSMMETARMFSEMMNHQNTAVPNQYHETERIKLIKSMLPYMDPSYAKQVNTLIKFIEIKTVLQTMSDASSPSQRQKQMLSAMQVVCPSNQKDMISKLHQLLEMKELMDTVTQIQTPQGDGHHV